MTEIDTRPLAYRPASEISDEEVAGWIAGHGGDRRIRALEYVGRDNSGRPMLRLKADGLEAGTYSLGRAAAMLSGSDRAPRRGAGHAPAPMPANPDAKFLGKTDASQMTDGELEWVEDMLGPHPHVSPDAAANEAQRRQDERRAMQPWERGRIERHAARVALNEVRVAAIQTQGLPDDGLPVLTGTVRQVAYALEIRAAYAKAHPGDRALKAATTAKYWIDNHKVVLRPPVRTDHMGRRVWG